jgi:alkanesulfonate monooxygenase SsuD/methylene tetrahydromethanopterin reductase-like flavin-dependent oxidoreductase (luciferase family)
VHEEPVRFGLFILFEWPGPARSFATMYEELLEQIEYAEEQGLEVVWLAEHHFVSYSASPSPLMFAIKAAGRTRRIRFGTGVLVLPFYHPLRLAGEVAVGRYPHGRPARDRCGPGRLPL